MRPNISRAARVTIHCSQLTIHYPVHKVKTESGGEHSFLAVLQQLLGPVNKPAVANLVTFSFEVNVYFVLNAFVVVDIFFRPMNCCYVCLRMTVGNILM